MVLYNILHTQAETKQEEEEEEEETAAGDGEVRFKINFAFVSHCFTL